MQADLGEFDTLLATMRRLRTPGSGCPWDLEQTHGSLRNTLLEESYEALEAIESGQPAQMIEELGDLMFQTVFHAQIGADAGTFAIADVIRHLNEKLIRRHPHVFGDAAASTAKEVIGQWERVKAAERSAKGQAERSMLDGVPKAMPALAYAQAVQERAARAGFEEGAETAALGPSTEAELGERLFALVADARRQGLDAEEALRGANRRFHARFSRVEALSRAEGRALAEMMPDERRALWERAGTGEA